MDLWARLKLSLGVLGDPQGPLGEISGDLRGILGLLWKAWGAFWGPWIALWKGLLAVGRPLGRVIGAFGSPWRTLGTFGSTGEHLQGAQSSFWQTVAAKSMVLRETLGELWTYLGDLWKHWR